ncbi:MAG: Abasic site processing protein [Verrucomicrobiota bacterium]|nr:Abasic site processing protein [Verrucomicrobiota bacterium]
MCGRYTLQQAEALKRLIESLTGQKYEELMARFNVAPTQRNPVVRADRTGGRSAGTMRWGLAPLRPTGGTTEAVHFNARSEEVLAKPTFRQAVQHRRCAVPADGFFEWKRINEQVRQPHLISLRERQPFFIAGICDEATALQPEAYALLTCGPNRLMADIHQRMPVILDGDRLERWLKPGPLSAGELASLCVPFDEKRMQAWPVGEVVNSARHDVPACVEPVAPFVDPQGAFGF